MNPPDTQQAESVANKIKHYLITTMGVTIDEANYHEFYKAFCLTLREEIMINWTASKHMIRSSKARTLYYLCMEYMPGRLLESSITGMRAQELIRMVLKRLGRAEPLLMRCETDPGLGNGGLGRLAACFLDSLATMQMPAMGYGLRYQYGIFDQEIWNGNQVERPDRWLLYENPWEFRRDLNAVPVYYAGRAVARSNRQGVEVYDLTDYEEVRALAYDFPVVGYRESADFQVLTLRLWSTKESPRNFELQRYNAGLLDQAAENTCLTDVLYPNDNNETGKRIRLKQEFLLVSASLQDIVAAHLHRGEGALEFADKVRIQINDTHPALVVAELMRKLLTDFDLGWAEAWEVVTSCCSYTNHTILKEALEEWNEHRIAYLLPRQMQIIERINYELCQRIRTRYPGDEERVRRMSILEDGQVRMAHLAIYGSHKVNGVAELHTEILKKEIFRDFFEMDPERFLSITNGITPRRWLLSANPALAEFVSDLVGGGWKRDLMQIQHLADHATDQSVQRRFLEIKRDGKRQLLEFLRHHNPIRGAHGELVGEYALMDERALFDVQIKRIHEYKRQLMNALHVLMLYHERLDNPQVERVSRLVLIAGKAAPGYSMAKAILQMISCLARRISRDERMRGKLELVFVENYNVSVAEKIIPAADLSQQISTAGTEASGTGNMKLALNGALTIGTEDGANIEMRAAVGDQFWPFRFGYDANEVRALREGGGYNPWDIYMGHEGIRRAVDALRDHSLAENQAEHAALLSIYHSLMEGGGSSKSDYYLVLGDLPAYYAIHQRAEALFKEPGRWAEYALRNIAAMGSFSSDYAISRYARDVWQIKPVPIDPGELERVRMEYSEHDKCRIFPTNGLSANGRVAG